MIALGAVSRPDLVPGLAEHGHDVWAFGGVPAAAEALSRFDGGRLARPRRRRSVSLPACPVRVRDPPRRVPARRVGSASETDLAVVTLQPMLMPNAGRDGSDWMAGELAERGISKRVGEQGRARGGRARRVRRGGEEPFDLLIAVPPHRPPAVVEESGLLAEHGWIGVDPYTLATSYERRVRRRRRQPDPARERPAAPEGGRDGGAPGLARGDGRSRPSCAASAEPPPFDGRGFCPVEVGAGRGGVRARESGTRSRSPSSGSTARARPTPPRSAAFETERLQRWFGG